MKYIDIIHVGSTQEYPRTSTLSLPSSLDETPSLTVMGNLPHGYQFRPKTKRDCDNLISWLKSLEY